MQRVVSGMDHPALVFKELEKCCEWYCEVLEYELVAEIEQGAKLLRGADGVYLEAIPSREEERPVRAYFAEGISHLALRVGDMEEAVEVLTRRGVVWSGEIMEAVGGGFVRNFRDPEGNELQIVSR